MATLTVGCKAYFDTFAGLIPCKVTAIKRDVLELSCATIDGIAVTARLTANRGAYKRGELVTASNRYIVPRTAVYVRSGQYHIGAYQTQVEV